MNIRSLFAIAFGLALTVAASAQNATTAPPSAQSQGGQGPGGQAQGGQGQRGGGRGGWGGGMGRGLMGTVTDVASDHYTIKTDTGETYTIHYSANTRILKQQARSAGGGQRGGGEGGPGGGNPPQTIKPTDIKVGDAIAAMGEVDAAAKSVGATMVMQIDPERAKQMREMQANYGKTWLMGKVTANDGVKVTLMGNVDNTAHSFVADENTAFRKRRDPITLADIQVGDTIRVEGAVKEGSFVATAVNAMGPPPEGAQGAPRGGPPSTQPQ
jgi:uncharacterized protein DUF5666